METEWRVRIVEDGPTYLRNVWFYRREGRKTVVLSFAGEKVTETTYDENAAIPISASLRLSPEMLQALANALSEANIRPKEAGKTEGLLEAQSEHLKDLRTLLKLK